jgi:uncharacterized Zn-finger protein
MELFSGEKPEKTRWVCKACTQEVLIKDIGAVIKGGNITIPLSGNCENIVAENDDVLCSKCSMQYAVRLIIKKALEENRPLTISELQICEEQLRANNYHEAYLKIENRKNLPNNSVRYDSMTFNGEGKLFIYFTCPKCFVEAIIVVLDASAKTPEQQLEVYMRLHEKLAMTCPSCNHNFTLWK